MIVDMERDTALDQAVNPSSYASAILNILADFNDEKARLADVQRAMLNILEDSGVEQRKLEDTQKATLNILADFNDEKTGLADVQRAMLNILEDSGVEQRKLEDTQKATLNILADFGDERAKFADVQKAVLNILEDFEVEKHTVEQMNREMAREITERKQAEARLFRQAEDLRRSNAELEQFAYVASHDLQEPLRMVASYTKLLEKRYQGKLDADADEFIGYVVEGAIRMRQLINSLLDYSRVGTRGSDFAPTSCETVLEQALKNLATPIEENNAMITHEPLPSVVADESQLTQLFQNLIGNAIRFRSEQTPKIHISAERQGEDWLFSVCDNGIGMESQYFDRIFIIFQRLHTRAEYAGTGIGLAICKKIVERHGGRIWVKSEPSQGSTFQFTLPVHKT